MDIAWITARQLLTMLIYMAFGFVLSRRKLISEEGSKAISTLLIYLIIPVVIIRSFLTGSSSEKTTGLLISIGLSVLCLLIAMIVSRIIFPKRPVDEFGSEFSNAGFLGIPLISATLGSEYVFYTAAFVALLNILQWSYGQARMGVKMGSWKTVAMNPMIVSFVLGLVLYFIQLEIPELIRNCFSSVAACNSPLAMVLLGIYLGNTDLKQVFTAKASWAVSGVRLVLIPVITLLVLTVIPADNYLRLTLFLVSAASVGSNVAMYAQRAGADHRSATCSVCLSTLLSVVSMPLLTAMATKLWGF